MCTLAVHWGWLDAVPGFPDRLRENPPRQGFFEHPEYLAVRAHLPAPWQDILDLAYYSGWRKQEILGLTWDEIDETGGVIRLSPARSKTLVGRMLPISQPIADALNRRRARRDPDSPLVFHRDGITIRRWRTAWRTACQAAGVPTRFLHDCRRTAARNLIRANVPERVAMLLTGHKSRAIFDRYNIIHEQELLDAGDQLVAYLAQQAQAVPARQRPHPAGPAARAPHHPSASYDAAPRKGARPPGTDAWPGAAVAGHRPPVRRGSRTGHRYDPARDRGTRSDGAGRRRRTRARPGPGCGCMPEGWMPLAGAGPHPPAGRCRTGAASGLMPGGRAARDEDGIHETGHAPSPCGISPAACVFAICSLWRAGFPTSKSASRSRPLCSCRCSLWSSGATTAVRTHRLGVLTIPPVAPLLEMLRMQSSNR